MSVVHTPDQAPLKLGKARKGTHKRSEEKSIPSQVVEDALEPANVQDCDDCGTRLHRHEFENGETLCPRCLDRQQREKGL